MIRQIKYLTIALYSIMALLGALGVGKSLVHRKLANTFDYSPERIEPSNLAYPWRAIGAIPGGDVLSNCTATLVAEDLILTVRHCVQDKDKIVLAGKAFNFYPGLQRGNAVIGGIQGFPIHWGGPDRAGDWALLALNKPIGQRLGYFGVDHRGTRLSSFEGTLPSSGSGIEASLCSETSEPYSFTSLIEKILDPATKGLPRVCLAGYSSDLGDGVMSLARECSFLGSQDGQWVHDCASTVGSSGAPLFYREQNSYYLSAMNWGEMRLADGKSRVGVEFQSSTFNFAQKPDAFFESIRYYRNNPRGKAFLFFQKSGGQPLETHELGAEAFLSERAELDDCGKQALASLSGSGLLDSTLNWRPDVAEKIADIKRFSLIEGQPREAGHLFVYTDSGRVYLGLISHWNQKEKSDASRIDIADGSCRLKEAAVMRYLNSKK